MIHRIRIQNFKSLRDVTVELSPVTVFVGRSGSGKTNFVSAIRFLRDYISSGEGRERPHQTPDVRCATNPERAISFEITFDVPGFESAFEYHVHLKEETGNVRPRIEHLNYGSQTLFRQSFDGRSKYQWDVAPGLVKPPSPGEPAIGRLPGLEAVVVAYTTLSTGIGVYSFSSNVLRKASGGRIESGLADDASNYLAVLKEIASSLRDISTRRSIAAMLRRLNPTVISVELDSIQNPQKAIVGHKWGDKVLPLQLDQESDGFRRFYAHLLALYQSPSKQTLIFEEPENGVYPGALSLLADEFKSAPEAGRGQILLTTHSPLLLDHFSAEQIRVVELVDLETKIGPLAEEQRAAVSEQLLHPGELLTVDPARREGAA